MSTNKWVRKIPWRRERLPTLAFWPGEFHGVCIGGHKESDTIERLSQFTISLISKSDKDITKKKKIKLQAYIFDEYRFKILNKIITIQTQ